MFEIVEKYKTLGGEAPIAGDPVYIIRFSNCNLNCSYCDTNYNNEVNIRQSIEELVLEIKTIHSEYPGIKIMLTGGEPLLGERNNQIIKLIEMCPSIHFFIETNGTIEFTNFSLSNCHYICDWKSPSAKVRTDFIIKNIASMRAGIDCIKFVVSESDLSWLTKSVNKINSINPDLSLYVSPQWGNIEFEKLAGFIVENKLNLSLSLQIHKIIWPPHQRGV